MYLQVLNFNIKIISAKDFWSRITKDQKKNWNAEIEDRINKFKWDEEIPDIFICGIKLFGIKYYNLIELNNYYLANNNNSSDNIIFFNNLKNKKKSSKSINKIRIDKLAKNRKIHNDEILKKIGKLKK